MPYSETLTWMVLVYQFNVSLIMIVTNMITSRDTNSLLFKKGKKYKGSIFFATINQKIKWSLPMIQTISNDIANNAGRD